MKEQFIRVLIHFTQKVCEILGFEMSNEKGTWEEQEIERIEDYLELYTDLSTKYTNKT